MKSSAVQWLIIAFLCVGSSVASEDIRLELDLSQSMFGPGSPFSLNLDLVNPGPPVIDGQLYVALSVGTDLWFYPRWVKYPPELDRFLLDINAQTFESIVIIPEFVWPGVSSDYWGAEFIAALIQNGNLASNLADCKFGWSASAQPTPTPIPDGFVLIQPGSFTMGSPDDEPCRESDETQHRVILTRRFILMQKEVSRQQWADLLAAQPDLPKDPSNLAYSPTLFQPVQSCTWYEAILFSNLMSIRDGLTVCYYTDALLSQPLDVNNYLSGAYFCNFDTNGYRLPTESEWEYACRAGTSTIFSFDEPNYNADTCGSCEAGTFPVLEQYCVFCANDPDGAAVVGSKLPNPWGLYDMHGNVFEWCWDWRGTYPAGCTIDPTGVDTGTHRVRRGGAYNVPAMRSRSALRLGRTPEFRCFLMGFRLARTIE